MDDSRAYALANGSLVFDEIYEFDSGVYLCEARNRLGRVKSTRTHLIVASIDINFVLEPSDTSVLSGNPVSLFCTPPFSEPMATVTWYKDYRMIEEREGEIVMLETAGGGSELKITSAEKSDEGGYYCVATNEYSVPKSRTSRIAQLTVNSK